MKKAILELKNITKIYPGVKALNNFSLKIYPGEVHALLGENGAGKSTLIKTISGAVTPNSGSIVFSDGLEVKSVHPDIAKKYGVEVIYQEFNLINSLTVAENISFGNKLGRFVNHKLMQDVAKNALEIFGIDINPKSSVFELPSSMQQIVEISKAISRDVKILIMDEPSAPLSVAEVDRMFDVVRKLKEKGVAVIYITHRMEEIFQISDKVTILRDGEYIKTVKTNETNRKELVSYMVGRELKEVFPKKQKSFDEVAIKVENLNGNGIKNVNFSVKKGEILGFSGLVGAGRTEMARLLYGADRKQSGRVIINGLDTRITSPQKAIKSRLGYIPEDRKKHGCLLNRSIKTNVTISTLDKISRFGVINRTKEKEIVEYYSKTLKVKSPSLDQLVNNLSGGNQQKVVVAKTLAANCNVIIFDEPTRGIDVGAKQEMYKLIIELADQGNAIILISSEMEEILGLSDRIIILYEGRINGELKKEEFSQEKILNIASGVRESGIYD